jgi:hypothetical protein
MPSHDDKRRMRKLKREIKRAGNRKRRRHFKHSLSDTAFDFGRDSSQFLNGIDRDSSHSGRG